MSAVAGKGKVNQRFAALAQRLFYILVDVVVVGFALWLAGAQL
ncbi:MAG: hypothetical protein RLZZ341_1244 [Pseudomonadota bacterium]